MLGRLRDAVADVRDAGSNATRWLGIDEAAAYMGSGNEKWRIVGARNAVAEEPELECNARAVECSISGAVRGHAALQLDGSSYRVLRRAERLFGLAQLLERPGLLRLHTALEHLGVAWAWRRGA